MYNFYLKKLFLGLQICIYTNIASYKAKKLLSMNTKKAQKMKELINKFTKMQTLSFDEISKEDIIQNFTLSDLNIESGIGEFWPALFIKRIELAEALENEYSTDKKKHLSANKVIAKLAEDKFFSVYKLLLFQVEEALGKVETLSQHEALNSKFNILDIRYEFEDNHILVDKIKQKRVSLLYNRMAAAYATTPVDIKNPNQYRRYVLDFTTSFDKKNWHKYPMLVQFVSLELEHNKKLLDKQQKFYFYFEKLMNKAEKQSAYSHIYEHNELEYNKLAKSIALGENLISQLETCLETLKSKPIAIGG